MCYKKKIYIYLQTRKDIKLLSVLGSLWFLSFSEALMVSGLSWPLVLSESFLQQFFFSSLRGFSNNFLPESVCFFVVDAEHKTTQIEIESCVIGLNLLRQNIYLKSI